MNQVSIQPADVTREVLLAFQKRWMADQSDVKVLEKGRQIGGTTVAEAADDTLIAATESKGMPAATEASLRDEVARDTVEEAYSLRPDQHVYYIGYVKEMAREFIEACAGWIERFGKAAGKMESFDYEDEFEENGHRIVKKIQAFQILFASGHRIVALSSAPRNLRGKRGIVVIDEAAFHDNLKELLKAAMALLIWGGKVRIISTHNGAENDFNELVNDIREKRVPYSLHTVTFDDAIRDGLYRKICQVNGKTWRPEGEVAFRAGVIAKYRENADEELFCIPRAGGGVYIPSALIEARMSRDVPVLRYHVKRSFLETTEYQRMKDAEDWITEHLEPAVKRLDPKLASCFGEDFARSGDLSVFMPMQIGQLLVRRVPFVIELWNVPFKQQEQILFWMIDHLPGFVGGAMDARGNGQYLAEQAQIKYGAAIEAVMLSEGWYREHMPPYKRAFEDAMIQLPKDPDILADHRLIRMVRGVPRIPDVHEKGANAETRHGDSAIAGCLAWYASTMDIPICHGYRPASSLETGRRSADRYEDDDRAGGRGFFRSIARFSKGAW